MRARVARVTFAVLLVGVVVAAVPAVDAGVEDTRVAPTPGPAHQQSVSGQAPGAAQSPGDAWTRTYESSDGRVVFHDAVAVGDGGSGSGPSLPPLPSLGG